MALHGPIRTRLLVLSICGAGTCGCQSWQPAQLTPAQLAGRGMPQEIRVTRSDGHHVLMQVPRVIADTLAGFGRDGQPAFVPMREVRSVAVLHLSAGKNVGLVLAIVLSYGLAGGIALAAGS